MKSGVDPVGTGVISQIPILIRHKLKISLQKQYIVVVHKIGPVRIQIQIFSFLRLIVFPVILNKQPYNICVINIQFLHRIWIYLILSNIFIHFRLKSFVYFYLFNLFIPFYCLYVNSVFIYLISRGVFILSSSSELTSFIKTIQCIKYSLYL